MIGWDSLPKVEIVCSAPKTYLYRGFGITEYLGHGWAVSLDVYYLHQDGTLHRLAANGGWFGMFNDAIRAVDNFYNRTLVEK